MKPILELRQVSKRYRIKHLAGGYLSLRERLMTSLTSTREEVEDFWALKDISMNVEMGQSLGIIGRNGAGKSTLLRILSRITMPSSGRIVARGRIASLLEVGTGFHAELTGRENIYFNGSLLGMRRREIDAKFDEIVDFSGAERFLDTAIKHYSNGMQLRLAFSVAAFLEPEIMLIDEVLAVGDSEFQQKCMRKMEDVSKSGRTILFVSHDLNSVGMLCDSVIVLNKGQIAFNGTAYDGIGYYQRESKKSETISVGAKNSGKPLYFQNVMVCDPTGHPCSTFLYDQPIRFDFSIGINEPVKCDLFVMILDARKRRLFALECPTIKPHMSLTIEPKTLVRGSYSICAFINQPNIARIDEVEDVCAFDIIDTGSPMVKHGGYDYGSVFGRGRWDI